MYKSIEDDHAVSQAHRDYGNAQMEAKRKANSRVVKMALRRA